MTRYFGWKTGLFFATACLGALASPRAKALDRILLIGDSHTAFTFGRTLDEQLRTIPNSRVSTVGSCGSSTSHWIDRDFITPCGQWEHDPTGQPRYLDQAPTPKLGTLLQQHTPDWVVVALGSNNIMQSIDPARLETEIRAMIRAARAKGAQCIWVGPPDMRVPPPDRITAFYDVLNRVAAEPDNGCRVIDSRRYTMYPPAVSDGTHYKGVLKPVAITWGRSIASDVRGIVTQPSPGVEMLHPEHERDSQMAR